MASPPTGDPVVDERTALREHMLHEERSILPNLSEDERRVIMSDHARYWKLLAIGVMPYKRDLERHAQLERAIYSKHGYNHED